MTHQLICTGGRYYRYLLYDDKTMITQIVRAYTCLGTSVPEEVAKRVVFVYFSFWGAVIHRGPNYRDSYRFFHFFIHR